MQVGIANISSGGDVGGQRTGSLLSPAVDPAALADNRGMPMAPPMGGMGGAGGNQKQRDRATWIEGDPAVWQDEEDDAVSSRAIGRGDG